MSSFVTAEEIVADASRELGLGAVNLANTSGDQLAYQALGLLNALGQEMLKMHDWQNMLRQMDFTGDGIATSFPLPADFGRQVNQTQWNRSNTQPLIGPDSPQVWAWSQFGLVGVGVMYRYRIANDEYELFPVPGAAQEFSLYYITKNWVQDGDTPSTLKPKVTKVNDVILFDSRMMINGLKVKLWAQKGFDTTVLQDEFINSTKAEMSQSQGAPVINLSNSNAHYYLNWLNIPDTNYGI